MLQVGQWEGWSVEYEDRNNCPCVREYASVRDAPWRL